MKLNAMVSRCSQDKVYLMRDNLLHNI